MSKRANRKAVAIAAAMAVAGVGSAAQAADVYWDINGTNTGATDSGTGVASGTWNTTTANWNLDSTGVGTGTQAFVAGDNVFFSAGTNATGTVNISVSGAMTAGNIAVEEGTVSLSGSAVANGTGFVSVGNGALLSIPNIANLTQAVGSTGLLLDGGTLRNTNAGSAGSFWDSDGTIRLTANGGTVNYTSSGTGTVSIYGSGTLTTATIVRDASVPAGTPVTLTKTGTHEFRYQGIGLQTTSYDKLRVTQGLFRLGFTGGFQDERGFGAVPASFMADQITLQGGGSIGASFNVTLHQNRGITLGTGGGALNGTGAVMTVPGAITGIGSLTTSGTVNLNGVNDYTGGYTLTSGTTTVGAAAQLTGATSTVTTNGGTLQLNNPAQTVGGLAGSAGTINLNSGHALTVNQAGNSAYGGVIGSTGSLTKSGAGTLTLNSVNTFTGATVVDGGTLALGNADTIAASASLTVNNGGTVQAVASLPKGVSLATVAATGTGKLDLTNNDLVVKSTTVAAVQALLLSGFNGGTWDGPGIQSSAAATDPNGFTALGYLSNADLGATEFSGVTGLDADDVLVKYTYYGDADLSGNVTLDDYSQFLFGFQNPVAASWSVGDFDYSGTVTLDDFSVFLLVFQNQGGPLGGLAEAISADTGLSEGSRAAMLGAIAAVPEPGTLGVLALAGMGLMGRRRRNAAGAAGGPSVA